jgi:hypothetical protein
MRQVRAVKLFCNSLDGLQASIATFSEGLSEFLLSAGYPRYYEEIEAIRSGLEDLNLYEEVKEAIRRSEVLVRAAKYEEAELLVLETSRKVSRLSGAEEDLRHKYTAANDPEPDA